MEIYNDGCSYLVNMYRALQSHDHEELANTVNSILYHELELNSRRHFLKQERDNLIKNINQDKHFYDIEIAADFMWVEGAAMDGVSTVYTPIENFTRGSFATGHHRGVNGDL